MNFIELSLLSFALAMDAFAVAMCQGLAMKKFNHKVAFKISLCFAFFQGLMPLFGWILGVGFHSYILKFDHWIAFFLLLFIAVRMIVETLDNDNNNDKETTKNSDILMMGLATSVDALAVGISFAVLPNINISMSCMVIASITLIISLIGVWIGKKFAYKLKTKAEICGSIILILIAFKILIEHLFFQ